MSGRSVIRREQQLILLVAMMILTQSAWGQVVVPTLLRLQRSSAELAIDQNSFGNGRNINEIATNNPESIDVWRYPNSAICLVVYNDGKYYFEKRDERTLGRPKAKSTEGVLTAEELQQLNAILDDEDLKKMTMPKAPELPSDAAAIRQMERVDLQIERSGTAQRLATVKERVKTQAFSGTTGPSSGMDTYLDNSGPSKKTLSPLMKWFDDFGKRSKSALKDAKPQYCQTMNFR